MPRFCSSCGAQMADNAAFCPNCGNAVATTGGTTTGPAQSQPAAAGGLADNVAGLLAYLFIPAIIFLVVEPYNRNRFIRFHSFQSIFYAIVCIAFNVIFGFVLMAIPIVGWAISFLISLALFIGWIVLMIKAYQGTMFKLPVIGDLAEKQANQ